MSMKTPATIVLSIAICAACVFGIQSQGMQALANQPSLEAAFPSLTKQATGAKASPKPTAKQIKKFKCAANDFAIELLKRSVAAKGKNANVTVSPYSVMNALAATANGAKGVTAREMRDVLGDGMSIASFNKVMKWYNGKLVNSSKARLRNANAIWYHNDGSLSMNKKFLKKCRAYYRAAVKGANFSDRATVDEINSWVADKTNGMIKRIVSQLDEADRIALVNALYFDAKWKAPFDPSDVGKMTFTTAAGKNRTIDMMHGKESRYIEADGVRGFMKPYAKGYSYVALLPDEGTTLKQFVASLNGSSFRSLVTGAKNEPVRIALPKQTLSYSNDSLEKQLAAMGMKNAFSPSADFSNMARDAKGRLYLGSVAHKTKVRVDENGTEAAAATAVVMRAGCAPTPIEHSVVLNRPFVYAIVDNKAKLPIFIGTVNALGR